MSGFGSGAIPKVLGLMQSDGIWLGMFLIFLAFGFELLLTKSVRDRSVLEQPVIARATITLTVFSILCFVGGILILIY